MIPWSTIPLPTVAATGLPELITPTLQDYEALAIALALFIAAVKASLVAAYFMHLATEKRIICAILLLTVFFFLFLLPRQQMFLLFQNIYLMILGYLFFYI